MNVGVVTDFYFPWIGGPSTVIANITQGLSSRGHEVHLLAPSPDGPGGDEREAAVSVTRAPTVPLPVGYRLRIARTPVASVSRWLDSCRPDVVHVHHPFPLSAAAILVARHRGIPVVATNHTIPACSLWGLRDVPLLYPAAVTGFGRWIRFLLDRCTLVATPTRSAARELEHLGYDRPVSVISNGVDAERFQPGPAPTKLRESLGLDGSPVVLYTGRLDAEKQMDVWLTAARLVGRSREVQFVVGGEGTDRTRLEHLAGELGIQDRTRFIGYVDEDTLPELYRLADVYCITSPVELQSIATLAALATGIPVVAVDAGALPELVDDGKNGRLAAPGSASDVAEALEWVLDTPDRMHMGEVSREIALLHDLQATIVQYEQLLEKAFADTKRGNAAA